MTLTQPTPSQKRYRISLDALRGTATAQRGSCRPHCPLPGAFGFISPEAKVMRARWGALIDNDPYYHRFELQAVISRSGSAETGLNGTTLERPPKSASSFRTTTTVGTLKARIEPNVSGLRGDLSDDASTDDTPATTFCWLLTTCAFGHSMTVGAACPLQWNMAYARPRESTSGSPSDDWADDKLETLLSVLDTNPSGSAYCQSWVRNGRIRLSLTTRVGRRC